MPSPAEARQLFRAFLRESSRMPNYNIREYIRLRAREGFREASALTDKVALSSLWDEAQRELAVVRRQTAVYGLYARKHKSVMELDHLVLKPAARAQDE